MIVRMLLLLPMLVQMRLNSIDASDSDEEQPHMGGEGFANIIQLVVLLGALLLAFLIVIAILAMTGQFEMDFVDPEV